MPTALPASSFRLVRENFPTWKKRCATSYWPLINSVIFHFPSVLRQPFVHYQVPVALNASKYTGGSEEVSSERCLCSNTTHTHTPTHACTQHKQLMLALQESESHRLLNHLSLAGNGDFAFFHRMRLFTSVYFSRSVRNWCQFCYRRLWFQFINAVVRIAAVTTSGLLSGSCGCSEHV